MSTQNAFVHAWGATETLAAPIPSWLAPKMPVKPAPLHIERVEPSQAEAAQEGEPAAGEEQAAHISLAESALRPPATPIIEDAEPLPPPYPDLREENAALKADLAEAMRTIARMHREVLDASESELVRLATTIAGRVVARELSTDPSMLIAWAKEGIAALDAEDGVTIALAPDLALALPSDAWAALGVAHRVEIDPSLPMSKCEVRTRASSVDVSGAGRLAAVTRELGGDE
jgi:flagellar biosynthesis/type III secretory pathway protein FliH